MRKFAAMPTVADACSLTILASIEIISESVCFKRGFPMVSVPVALFAAFLVPVDSVLNALPPPGAMFCAVKPLNACEGWATQAQGRQSNQYNKLAGMFHGCLLVVCLEPQHGSQVQLTVAGLNVD
jgi:hypothetical protein